MNLQRDSWRLKTGKASLNSSCRLTDVWSIYFSASSSVKWGLSWSPQWLNELSHDNVLRIVSGTCKALCSYHCRYYQMSLLSMPRGCRMIFISESYLITWPHFKVEIDIQVGFLCELLIGKWIHNTLSTLTKFHLCAGAQPGGLCKLFPRQQWHDASRCVIGRQRSSFQKTCLLVFQD